MALNIVLVDDDPDILDVLSELIELLDQEAIRVNSGQECLDKCKEGKVDIVITDLDMPDIDGLNLSKEIKKINTEVEVYLLSGYSSILSEKELADSGIRKVLAKPFTVEDIQEIIESKLND